MKDNYLFYINIGINGFKSMRKDKGFTLLEVIVVIAIIGIMSAIAIPNYMSWVSDNADESCCTGFEISYEYGQAQSDP